MLNRMAGVLLAALGWSTVEMALGEEPTSAPKSSQAEPLSPADEATRDILKIREQLGTPPLRGTIFDQTPPGAPPVDDDAIFRDALRRGTATPAVAPPVESQRARTTIAPAGQELASRLRGWARQLDQLADELEESASYAMADALRRLAQEARLEARQLRSVPEDASSTTSTFRRGESPQNR